MIAVCGKRRSQKQIRTCSPPVDVITIGLRMDDSLSPAKAISIDEFRALALAELPAVYRLAIHLCGDRTDADDLVQETYLRALRAAERFRLSSLGIRPWLFRILHNTLRNRWRAQAAAPSVEPLIEGSTNQPVAGDERSDGLNWDDVDERLAAAVSALPDEFRTPFLLFAVEDLKYREIAAVLDVPIGTVMSRLARARRQLIERLSDFAGMGHERIKG
jgi:RNA polymerase sigma-70 factor (ECF subfamily)